MMFGSHLSIAGSMTNALNEARNLHMDTVQVFTKNQRQWRVKPLDPAAISEWTSKLNELGWQDRTVSHASYLINLASPDDELWHKSINLMIDEITRCQTLNIPFLVHHPGAYTTSTADAGLTRIAHAYKTIFEKTPDCPVICCLENTVGSGSNLGRTFQELATLRKRILEQTDCPRRVAYCFDTCHAHAGGYDMSSRTLGQHALDEFDQLCNLDNLRVLHLNDSIGDVASKKDRHAHIGEGTIGISTTHKTLINSGFAAVLNHPKLADKPMILETPKGTTPKGSALDTLNLSRLKKLIESSSPEPNTPQ